MGRLKGSKNGFLTLVSKVCQTCGKEFFVEPWKDRKGDTVACSRTCQADWHAKTMLRPTYRVCPICGTGFVTKPASKQIYCSLKCGHEAHKEKMRLRWNRPYGSRRRKPDSCKCRICGKIFVPTVEKQKLCSPECANKSFVRRIELTCPICKRIYFVQPSHRDQKTCSRTCRTAWIGMTESKIEKAMEAALQKANIPFTKQFPFGPYTCDFAIRDARLCIECDGSYWHSLPENIEHDRRRDNYFRSHKWYTLRFDERQIRQDIQGCIAAIHAAIFSLP